MKINIITISALLAFAASTTVGAMHDKKDKHKKLPPGLQKKVDQGKPLPPGWQKKLRVGERLDDDIYRHARVVVPVDDRGLVTVAVEGRMVRLIQASREVVEILDSL